VLIATNVTSGVAVLVVAVFLTSCVEMIEALTIVLAVGHTRGWRSCVEGVGAALVALVVLVAVVGPALVRVPLSTLHLVIGVILLIFGMQWLRKAILRSSGLKEKNDEDVRYERTVASLETSEPAKRRDQVAFVVAFKGVFLEGLEVVIAVITLGTSAHRLGLAALVAAIAVVLVGVVGAVVSKQLTKVPENAMKMGVGILLTSYGTFWTGEGLKVRWPEADIGLLVLVGVYAVVTWLFIVALRRRSGAILEVTS
jgi:uncharacterized membrane protein